MPVAVGGAVRSLHVRAGCPQSDGRSVEVRLVELPRAASGVGRDRLDYRLAKEGLDPVPSRAAIGRALTPDGVDPSRSVRRPPSGTTGVGAGPGFRWSCGRWTSMGGVVMLDDGTEVKAVDGIDGKLPVHDRGRSGRAGHLPPALDGVWPGPGAVGATRGDP